MPRAPRRHLSDGTYHLTSRGNRGQLIFADDGDRRFFLHLLRRVAREQSWVVFGYCLLDTHYHLVVETSAAPLSAGMRLLNGAYAQCFNGRHGLDGHLFQGRFYAGKVQADGHLLELTRYIALNPVRAGLVADPGGWPWGSYPSLIGREPAEAFLAVNRVLGIFAGGERRARDVFRSFVEQNTEPR